MVIHIYEDKTLHGHHCAHLKSSNVLQNLITYGQVKIALKYIHCGKNQPIA
jgi:hypothetical protein